MFLAPLARSAFRYDLLSIQISFLLDFALPQLSVIALPVSRIPVKSLWP